MNRYKIDIYADGADAQSMIKQHEEGVVTGFTTNPSLMKKAGVTDYVAFAKEVVEKIPDAPLSFEVFGDDFETMEKEAEVISALGKNVFVKIPCMNTKYESSAPLIKRLTEKGIKVNVTVIMTEKQAKEMIDAVCPGTEAIISVFAGRIADVGVDPEPIVKNIVEYAKKNSNIKILWASTREVYNIYQAEKLGCHIITVPADVIKKLSGLGKDLTELSHDGIMAFAKDIKSMGFSILG